MTHRPGILDGDADAAVNPMAEVADAARDLTGAWARAANPAKPDPHAALDALAAVRRLANTVDDALRATVDRARACGRTWQEIGDILGTTRQAAFQRFGRPTDPRTGQPLPRNLLPNAADRAVRLLMDLIEGRHAEIRGHLDDAALKALGDLDLAGVYPQLMSMVGPYEGIGEPFVHPFGLTTVVDVPMRFEAADMVGRVTFRQDGRVSGMVIRQPAALP